MQSRKLYLWLEKKTDLTFPSPYLYLEGAINENAYSNTSECKNVFFFFCIEPNPIQLFRDEG